MSVLRNWWAASHPAAKQGWWWWNRDWVMWPWRMPGEASHSSNVPRVSDRGCSQDLGGRGCCLTPGLPPIFELQGAPFGHDVKDGGSWWRVLLWHGWAALFPPVRRDHCFLSPQTAWKTRVFTGWDAATLTFHEDGLSVSCCDSSNNILHISCPIRSEGWIPSGTSQQRIFHTRKFKFRWKWGFSVEILMTVIGKRKSRKSE